MARAELFFFEVRRGLDRDSLKSRSRSHGGDVRMCKLLRHSYHSAQMLIVSVARQRILIYPAWSSQPLRVEATNKSSYAHRTPPICAICTRYLGQSDRMSVEFRELEHFRGLEDSQGNLMYMLTMASMRDSSVLEIFSTSGSEKYQEQKMAQQDRLQRRARKDDDNGDLCWTEAGERLGRRMLQYFEDSESTQVGI